MKKLIGATAAAALAAGVLAGPSLGSSTKTVTVKDNAFSPTTLTVKRGTKVRWVWRGHAPHNVFVKQGPVRFHSSIQTSGSFSKVLKKAGTYKIVCTIHAPGMHMTLRVK